MLTTSISENFVWADSNALNAIVIPILRLLFRWSCSTILLCYLHCLIFIFWIEVALFFTDQIAILLVQYLSTLTTLGLPLFPMALLKNFCADIFCLLLVNRKSTVFPSLSLALFKYLSLPPTLMNGSSVLRMSTTWSSNVSVK
jgi:hypothetical protein